MILFWRLSPAMVFGEMQLAGLSFHMGLLAKLSFQGYEEARAGARNQWFPAPRKRQGMVPIRQNYGSSHTQHSALPVHILQPNSKDFGCAEAIRCQQQHNRIITFAWRFRPRDPPQNLLHVAPRQTAWGPLIYPISRCDHSAGQISRQPSCHVQKSEKPSKRTAGIRDGSSRKTGGKLPHKSIHICQVSLCNGDPSTAQLLEEATRSLDIAHQRPFRDPIVGSPIMAILLQ